MGPEAGPRELVPPFKGPWLGGRQEAGSGAGKRPIHQAHCPLPGLRAQLPEKGPHLRPGEGLTLESTFLCCLSRHKARGGMGPRKTGL